MKWSGWSHIPQPSARLYASRDRPASDSDVDFALIYGQPAIPRKQSVPGQTPQPVRWPSAVAHAVPERLERFFLAALPLDGFHEQQHRPAFLAEGAHQVALSQADFRFREVLAAGLPV